MDAWVYLFSKFTHEALLFEALAIFLGLFGYAVFYLIRKRKYGVAGKEVPTNVMKVYLAQLMGDAEEIRNQLFGLLGKGEASARLMANVQFQADMPSLASGGAGATLAGAPVATTQLVQDPKLAEKLQELERKLSEQAASLDSVLNEKMQLEEELANARSSPGGEDGKPLDRAAAERSTQLGERVKQLEAQLAEYAIIEDDLANLKRLQKENKSLKQQIAEAGNTPNLTAVSKPTVAPRVQPGPEIASAPAPLAAKAPETKRETAEPEIATESVDDSHANDPDHPADFESLVDVVEKNLADAAKSANVDPSAATAPEFSLESGPASENKTDEKSEEQLQADFEKMLNS